MGDKYAYESCYSIAKIIGSFSNKDAVYADHHNVHLNADTEKTFCDIQNAHKNKTIYVWEVLF